MSLARTTSTLTEAGALLAAAGESVRATRDFDPMLWSIAAAWSFKRKKLKDKYGKLGAMPKKWAEVSPNILAALHPDLLRQCRELLKLGMELNAIRLAYCGKLGRVYECSECGRPYKRVVSCKNAMCCACAKRNFDSLFKRYFAVDALISPAVRSLPGWTWNVLDFSFRHDGDLPTQWELRQMIKVIRRTVERAVKEACRRWFRARSGCRLRFNGDGSPMLSRNGWPIASTPDGSARELVGWTVVFSPEHTAPDNKARKQGTRGAQKQIPARHRLRFGYELIRVREFGFDNVNAHFHGAYFGPRLNYWKAETKPKLICGGRLVEIFKEESRRELGEESYTVYFEKAREGFSSVLAHALKYTKKIPSSTPEGLAQLEHAMQGTRRVALLGAHYGVSLSVKPNEPKCDACGAVLRCVDGLGLVPLNEIQDLPRVNDDHLGSDEVPHEPGTDEFLEPETRGP